MPQILIILASALLIIKQFFGSFKVSDNQKKAFTIVLLAILIYIGYKFYLKSKLDKEIGSNIDAQLASRLKLAFDPYEMFGLGTDEDEVFKVANEIKAKTTYEAVASAYQTLYSKSLTTDLQSELSPSDYAKFTETVYNGGTPTGGMGSGGSTGGGGSTQPAPIKQVKTIAIANTFKLVNGKTEIIQKDIPKGTTLGKYIGGATLYFNGNPYPAIKFEYTEFSWLWPFYAVSTGFVLKSQVSIS